MDKIIERSIYTDKIKGFIGKEVIKIITGIRRCGKSEILKLLRQEVLKLTDQAHIVFINFEDVEFDYIKTYKELHDYALSQMKDDKKYYLFFDEIQQVAEWEKAINSLRLKNADIYITGSNSKLLSGELATLLGGRYVQFEIRPLSYREFLQFQDTFEPVALNGSGSFGDVSKSNDRYAVVPAMDTVKKFMEYGGFPFISTQGFTIGQAALVVKDIHASIILKDVVSRNRVGNVPLLEKVVAYFYDTIGNLTSLRRIAEYISGGEKKKVTMNLDVISSYVGYLEAAYVIKRVPRYDIKGKKLFETNDKYYLADHSLAYVIKDVSKVNKGGILENMVYAELIARGYTVYVGKLDTKEVDFVAEKNGERLYVQVCLEFTTQETYDREFAPLKEIKDNHPKYVVSLDSHANRNDDGVIGISLKDFLLADNL